MSLYKQNIGKQKYYRDIGKYYQNIGKIVIQLKYSKYRKVNNIVNSVFRCFLPPRVVCTWRWFCTWEWNGGKEKNRKSIIYKGGRRKKEMNIEKNVKGSTNRDVQM